jgi:hypothetical protein
MPVMWIAGPQDRRGAQGRLPEAGPLTLIVAQASRKPARRGESGQDQAGSLSRGP